MLNLEEQEITLDQLGKHCYECKNCNWYFGGPDNIPFTWECTKRMPFDPEKDINEKHGWLELDGRRLHPDIYAEAIKQCSGYEIDYEKLHKNLIMQDFFNSIIK